MKKITREELSQSDGRDGRPAHVAADGLVYDVSASRMWRDGRHMNSHQAGDDLTAAIEAAPHGPEVLERVEKVGELAPAEETGDSPAAGVPEPSPFIRWVLGQHPHPASAHFPIGLGVAAAVFSMASLVFDAVGLAEAGFYNLVFAAVTAPAVIGAGVLSWYYNFGAAWNGRFIAKICLSLLLLFIIGLALGLRLAFFDGEEPSGAARGAYLALVALVAPNVVFLGRIGGKISFKI